MTTYPIKLTPEVRVSLSAMMFLQFFIWGALDALRLMRERSFAVFVICSLLICIPLAFYYNFANLFLNEKGIANAAGKMTMGQICVPRSGHRLRHCSG